MLDEPIGHRSPAVVSLQPSPPAVAVLPEPSTNPGQPVQHLVLEPGAGRAPRRIAPWLALMSGLAVLLNAWPIPLYYGVQLLLGSVPPILALLLWRTWWAVPMGALAALQTWRLWGHPWAVLIFTLELVWLTLAMRRCNGPPSRDGNGRVVVFSMAYWLLLGCPLVLLSYGLVLGIDAANVVVVAFKQAFNGVFNTVLAFSAMILIQGLRSRHNRGPGVSLRGVIMALALLAITLPTLLISLTAGRQLEVAIQRGALDGLETVNMAIARASADDRTTRLLMQQLGESIAYRRIAADGSVSTSAPELFNRLDSGFEDGGRTNVHEPDLAILIPRGKAPLLRKWVNGYWSYNRQYANPAGGTDLVQVVEPARTVVTRLQQQSTTLLGATFAVMVLGTLAGLWIGRMFEREFKQVLSPLLQERQRERLQPLELSEVSELRTMAQLINHRIQQVNRLSQKLRQANASLRRSRAEMHGLLHLDPLTGCENELALQQRLPEELARCRRSGEALSCLVLEVDDFRSINSTHGRAAGEALLRGLAEAVQKRLRQTDHTYRVGKDGFVVLAIGCPPADAPQLGRALQDAMAQVFITPAERLGPGADLQLRASVSVGISSLDPADTSTEALLQRAQEALSEARQQGPGALRMAPRPHQGSD